MKIPRKPLNSSRTSGWREWVVLPLRTTSGSVEEGMVRGRIRDALVGRPTMVRASLGGMVIGMRREAAANRGEAPLHIGDTT